MSIFGLLILKILTFCVGLAPASMLHDAIYYEKWNLVKGWANKSNVNELDTTGPNPKSPLLMVIQRKRRDIAEHFLKLGADVHFMGERALFYAVSVGSRNLVELLLDWGANADYADSADDGIRPIFYAYADPTGEIAELLMERGAQPDVPDENGMTPIIMCAKMNRLEVMKKLVARGADIHRSYRSKSVLYWAALGNGAEILKYLSSLGAKLEVADEEGRTPLMVTASFYMLKSTEALLECGASVHARDIYGCTALFNAIVTPLMNVMGFQLLAPYGTLRSAVHRRLEVIRLLIDEGSDVDTINKKGNSLLNLLLRRRQEDDNFILAFLILAGMNVGNCDLLESLKLLTVGSVGEVFPEECPKEFLNRVLKATANVSDLEALKKWHISLIKAYDYEKSLFVAAFVIARRYYTLERKYRFPFPYKGVIEEKICRSYSEMYADLLRITYLGSLPPDVFYDVLFYAKKGLRTRILSRAILMEIMDVCGNDSVALINYGTSMVEFQPYIEDILNDHLL